jgi:hypothetical protein
MEQVSQVSQVLQVSHVLQVRPAASVREYADIPARVIGQARPEVAERIWSAVAEWLLRNVPTETEAV